MVVGDISCGGSAYPFRTRPERPADARLATSNWAGFVRLFRLDRDRSLQLVAYEYEVSDGRRSQQVGERLEGDFWMVFTDESRRLLIPPTTFVPFIGGQLEVDPSRRRVDPGGSGLLRSVLRRPGLYAGGDATAAGVLRFIEHCLTNGIHPEERPSLLHFIERVQTSANAPESADEHFDPEVLLRALYAFGDDADVLRWMRELWLGWVD